MTAKHIIDMTGKVVLITGGSRGLGREMALGFAEAGADLIIASRKMPNCEAVAAEIEAMGRRALPVGAHVAQWDQCDKLIEAAYHAFGRVDVLINNAGMSPIYDKPTDIDEMLYDKVLDLNLKGPFRLSTVIGERMMEGDGGSIINVSSVAAIRPRKNVITYAAAKAGLNAMTEALADAYGPNVRVNGIMPGPFLTDISKAWDMDAFQKRADEAIAMRRGGAPDEVTAAALYLASDHAGYTTGAILKIDGGSR
ncbi:MAG: SDR family NAD(P)-dependent oxidoreductase [Minwuia sp.]|uniref:SDR family NAD(P)-dependent oxidoreductase n=1 Tax=Minwuia sp. TaxID=2493630 RepID=UPI003A889536